MPIYEFYSPDTHRIYSFFARKVMGHEVVPRCPDGGDKRMEKMVSRFAFVGRAKEPGAGGADDGDLDEAAMMELAREMEGLDENNPDPKAMGALMRRMAGMTGQKLPAQMEEMVRRMEAGEDMEKLEEEFGDLSDEELMPGMDEAGREAAGRLLRGLRARPRRDPTLYEMADYV